MLDRTTAPPYVEDSSFDLITPERIQLPNGVDVFFVCGGAQDVLKIELLFRAGRWYEKKAGSGYFTAHLLNKGTRYNDSFQIAQLLDQYGAHFEVSPGMDFVSISLYALSRTLEPVIHLFREIIKEPVFPKKEIDLAKSIYVQNLKVNNEKTSFVASKTLRKSLFGESHPYGREVEMDDVNSLTQQHLFEHYDNNLQDFCVFVSGKIEEPHKQLIAEAFGSFTVRRPARVEWPAPEHVPTDVFLPRENAVQSSLRFGQKSLTRSHPDYVKSIFINHLLGGFFGSRLMRNIREDKGLTYGIYSSLQALYHDSYLTIGADVNKENVSMAFAEIRKELKRLHNEAVPADELTTARNHFIGSLQAELTTPFAHAEKLKTIYLYDLPPTYYRDMILGVQEIRSDDVAAIAGKHFDEKRFTEVAVG